jgi:hypothetical protein
MANSNPSKDLSTFIGLQNMQHVGNSYTGISFSSNILVLRSVTRGGSGAALATLALAANNLLGTGFPSYCNWTSASLGFSGTAKSVTYAGPAKGLGIADITPDETTSSVPEPSSVYLLGTGLMALTLVGVRRFRKTS